jgi:hypothetical protein
MKKIKYSYIALATILMVGSCKQEVIETTPPEAPTSTTPSKGSADFTKFVAVGSSFTAGMQAQALFNESQANSLPRIMARQFETVGGPATFNQPDINSVNGFNPISSNVGIGLILGRLVLFDPDGTGPRSAGPAAAHAPSVSVTCPSPVTTPATPAPYNTADLPTAYTGNKAALNNFSVPLIYTAQTLTPATGGPNPGANPAANPAFTPYYQRFASNPSSNGTTGSTIIGDAKVAAGSFYLIWLGIDDVLLYAATGADGATTGTYPMTDVGAFTTYYNGAIATLLGGTTFKGVVGNIPDFTSLPYFYTVTWNNVTLDAATAASVTSNLDVNYNAFLDGMVANNIITDAERTKRRLTHVAGKNGILMTDEELTNLAPYMAGPYAGLAPFARARQATATDLVPLAAGSVLGTCFGGSPTAVLGVSYPVSDQYILTATETTNILARTASLNNVITTAVAGSAGRLVVADVRKAYNDFVAAKGAVSDGVFITPSFAPPTGAWSEDGLHPNARGYAFTANVFIDAINSGFQANVPKANLAAYSATGLPVVP